MRWIVWVVLSISGGCASGGAVSSATRAFDMGGVDRGCEIARDAFRRPHSVKETLRIPEALDRCAFELAARENTKSALEAYLSGAPARSGWVPVASRMLCGLDPRYPGCQDSRPQVPVRLAAASSMVGNGDRTDLPSLDKPLRTGARRPQDAALVIGLENYPFATPVPHAARDAQAFADHLRYTVGVPDSRIEVLTAGSIEALRDAARRVAQRTSKGGTLWVYYAGHGASHPRTRERLILGDDLRPDPTSLASRGMSVEALIRQARGDAGQVVAVLDTCFTGTGRDGSEIIEGARFVIPTSAVRLENVIEWSSTGPGEIALPITSQRHGAFTWLVLGALRGWADGEIDGVRDGQVTLEEASVYVRRSLRALGFDGMTAPLQAPDSALAKVLVESVNEPSPTW
jgi:hypothetical protein